MSNEPIRPQKVVTKSLKELGLDEKWLQEQIENDPGMLGLGSDVPVCEKRRRQPSGGRLDILLEDTENEWRYEVEIQRGRVDESRITRAIEYWDKKCQQNPQQKHKCCGVIVAEEITGHFSNVIGLSNEHVPLIVIKLTAIMCPSGEIGLHFTRVLDEVRPRKEEEEASAHETWMQKHGPEFADAIFQSMRPDSAKKEPNYARGYIAMQKGKNHVLWLKYQKNAVRVEFAYPEPNRELEEQLRAAGVEPKYYENVRPPQYRFNVRIAADSTLKQLSAIVKRVLGGNA